MKDRILSVEEAAEILGLHPSRVRVFCDTQRLPARKIGKGWALLLSDVEAFKRQDRKVGRPPRWPMPSPSRREPGAAPAVPERMDPRLRVVTSFPLQELWTTDGPVEARRLRWLDHESVRQLVRGALETLVIADVAGPLVWRIGREAVVACWNDVKDNIADPERRIDLDDYPGNYCFLASEWRTPDNETIVVLQRHH